MDFDLTEEQQMLRDGARRYVRETFDIESRRALARAGQAFDEARWSDFAELGWLALGLPEDVGGLGCSFVETALLMEELGRGLVPAPYVSSAVLGARLLERCDNPVQRKTVLGAVAQGSLRLALAHLEPGSRYQPQPVSVQASRTADGYRLDGMKSMVHDAAAAHYLLVSASVAGDAGYSLFLVDRDAVGVTLADYPLIDDSHAADVGFAQVPVAALLCGPGKASALVDEALDRATLARVAETLGAMESALALTADYLKARQQFGQPIGKFQALQHRMSEMFIEVQETRSALYCGLAHLDAAPELRQAMISAAKIVSANAARIVGGQGIQLHGGMGVTDEAAIGHYYKKLIALEKMWRDTDWHLERFARHCAR